MPVSGTDDDSASYDHARGDEIFLTSVGEAHFALGEFEAANDLFLSDRQNAAAVNDAALKAGHAIASIVGSLVGIVGGHLEARGGVVSDPDETRIGLGRALSDGFLSAVAGSGPGDPFSDAIPAAIMAAVRARIG